MKRTVNFLICISILLGLCACKKAPTWEEQYELGVRYLLESNYEEAVLAFTAAIEIDPKRQEAYEGRGDAYVGQENYEGAASDYEAVLDIDESYEDVYEKLAEVYIKQGDMEKAMELWRRAYESTGNEKFKKKLDELNGPQTGSSSGKRLVEERSYSDRGSNNSIEYSYDEQGRVKMFFNYHWDENYGQMEGIDNFLYTYGEDGSLLKEELVNTYGTGEPQTDDSGFFYTFENGRVSNLKDKYGDLYTANTSLIYDSAGRLISSEQEFYEGVYSYYTTNYEYDQAGMLVSVEYTVQRTDYETGELGQKSTSRWEFTHNEMGLIDTSEYYIDSTGQSSTVTKFDYDFAGDYLKISVKDTSVDLSSYEIFLITPNNELSIENGTLCYTHNGYPLTEFYTSGLYTYGSYVFTEPNGVPLVTIYADETSSYDEDGFPTSYESDYGRTEYFYEGGSGESGSPDDEPWRQLYLDIIENDDADLGEYTKYYLLYIDDDEIPELYINYGINAYGGRFFTVKNGQLSEIYTTAYGMDYIEKGNAVFYSIGNSDHYFDTVLSIQNGGFTELHKGEYGFLSGERVVNEDGPVYEYTWDSQSVSAEEYENLKNSAFDFSASKYTENGMSYLEITEKLRRG